MTPVILESPYAGEIERNKAYLQLCIRDCISRNESPFASHQMFTDALDDLNSKERQKGIAAGLVWSQLARRTVVYTDFGISTEMAHGIEHAHRNGRVVECRVLFQDNTIAYLFFQDEDREKRTVWQALVARARANGWGSPKCTP